MICYHFGMHRAGVLLLFLLLVIVLVLAGRAIGFNRPYLCSGADGERNCTSKNDPFQHVVDCLVSVVAAVSAAEACANEGGTPAATVEDPRCGSALARQE